MLENNRRTWRRGTKEISSIILNDVYEFFICLVPVRLSLTLQHGGEHKATLVHPDDTVKPR